MTAIAPSALDMVDPRPLALSGDSFAKLVAQHQRAVCAVAFSALRDRAASEEVAQEAFLVAWKKLPGLSEPPKLPAWICGIARNLAKNARRAQEKVEPSDALDDVATAAAGPLDALLDAESDAIVERALASLEDSYREPLVLFYRQDLSMREVAAALDISEVNAKQRISRGRAQLAERVHHIVERSLRGSGPGKAFTSAVVGAVAALPKSAQAKPAAGVASGVSSSWWIAAALVGALGIGAALTSASGSDGALALGPSSADAQDSVATSARAEESGGSARAARSHPSPGPRFKPRQGRTQSARVVPPSAATALHDRLDVALQKKIDLELKEAKTGEVLRLLGDIASTPVIVRGEIGDEVSVNLRAVSVQQALDETLEAAGAVWDEIDLLRVVGTPGAAGPELGGPKLDLHLVDAPFNDVVQALGQSLELSVFVAEDVAAKPVTIEVKAAVAGDVFAQVVSAAGLRWEIVPAIEVRADDE